ncbi:DUF6114 domain-containing protein [Nocardioides speluncae]|uniref:DUF6114 domain-containing protein n=1 Tax=Nocardioides speluncae TaxID=2670337 RepID=UPI00197D4BFF|nr:DUF6114 domain-containing protein [Nocardioides speluncae]
MATTEMTPTSPPLLRRALKNGWTWFADFRRTRPFWGALWLALGGYAVLHFASTSIGIAIAGGWSGSAGYILGGGMILFAVVAVATPQYSALCGLIGVLLALAAFIAANLGGFLVGSVLGIFGGSMIWGWGEKKPRNEQS